MLNPNGERLDGDTSLASFGIRDPVKVHEQQQQQQARAGRALGSAGNEGGSPAGGSSSGAGAGSSSSLRALATDVLGVNPRTTLGRYERALLGPVFKGDAGAFLDYLDALARTSTKCKAHQKCLCGSGARFAGCCSELQIYLHQIAYRRGDFVSR